MLGSANASGTDMDTSLRASPLHGVSWVYYSAIPFAVIAAVAFALIIAAAIAGSGTMR